jgi:hypothetical protein
MQLVQHNTQTYHTSCLRCVFTYLGSSGALPLGDAPDLGPRVEPPTSSPNASSSRRGACLPQGHSPLSSGGGGGQGRRGGQLLLAAGLYELLHLSSTGAWETGGWGGEWECRRGWTRQGTAG